MKTISLTLTLLLLVVSTVAAQDEKAEDAKRFTDPKVAAEKAPSFRLQGEYAGELTTPDGETLKLGVQVIALGDGKFNAVTHFGGLPGAGWNGEERNETAGAMAGQGQALFQGDQVQAKLDGKTLAIETYSGEKLGSLKRIERKSKTLGKKPPQSAIVLFDGKNVSQWRDGAKMTKDGLLKQGVTSKQKFGDHHIHVEFRLPYEPNDRGQQRGNSGLYLQGRFEVQMLDSFGLSGEDNECGGIYTVKKPDVNMCFPPLTWQTYDVDFTAARYDAEGNMQSPPKITVRHNGVLIHKDVELPGERTRAAPQQAGPNPGPVFLQDHTDEVRYRNIWVVEN